MRIILLNGPPSSGKDLAARLLIEELENQSIDWKFLRMSHPIKRAFAGMMDASIDEWGNVKGWEEMKDLPSELLNGKTYRQWQIDFNETLMKPLYSEDIFARIFCDTVSSVDYPIDADLEKWNGYVIVPDCGFEIEASTVGRLLPNVRILLCHVRRPGTDFSKDSRSYIFPKNIPLIWALDNDGTIDQWREKVLTLLRRTTWEGFAG